MTSDAPPPAVARSAMEGPEEPLSMKQQIAFCSMVTGASYVLRQRRKFYCFEFSAIMKQADAGKSPSDEVY
ncbi:hypothetical protein KCP74_14665 [Salmonella enterica subsp. enterica]|nr:hypothetical protein KCP74_14665 [Salmonella enterica subsp. enterica]